ncbi:MAG: hypothetical protein HYZ75_01840 [Elusimicrobia bacterium]|nr:hypothetical protein [Elusimicrobiota bacterium]
MLSWALLTLVAFPARADEPHYEIPFSTASAELGPEGAAVLERLVDTLHYYPWDSVFIRGFSAATEDPALGKTRAEAVLKALLARKVTGHRAARGTKGPWEVIWRKFRLRWRKGAPGDQKAQVTLLGEDEEFP